MARLGKEVAPYEAALAGYGVAQPAPAHSYVRGHSGLTPAPSPGIAQAAAAYSKPPSVVYNPNYYTHTAAGRREMAERQRAATESQIRDARQGLERQSQIVQSGAHVFSPDELSQRREVVQSALSALNAVGPLASSGLMDPGAIRQTVGKAVQDSFAHQRNRRMASRDVEQIRQLYETGRIGVDVATKALNAAEGEYGQGVMLEVPSYVEMAGLGSQLVEERTQAQAAYAEKHDIPGNLVTWDDRKNKPTFDREAATIETWKTQQRGTETRRRVEAAGPRPERPQRWRYKSDLFGGDQAADKAYQNDMVSWSREHLDRTASIYGPDSMEAKEAAKMYGQAKTAGSTTAPSADLQSKDMVDIAQTEKLVKAGFLPAGKYKGMDGNEYKLEAD